MLNLLINSINAIRSVSGLDSDASAFITAAGLTDPTQKSAINTLVKDMKAAGLWSKMKAVYPMVGGTATSMKFNLKDPRDLDAAFRLTWSGGWTYSATGATPNGTNAYADTYLIPNTTLTFNSVSLSFYSRNDFTPGANQGIGCTANGSNALPLINLGLTPTKQVYSSLYSYNAPDAIISSTGQNLSGLSCVSRTSATSLNLYKNATNLATRTANNQTTQPTNAITIGAFRNVNTIQDYCSFQYAFAHIGDGLTNQDYLLLNQIVEKYQVALSRGVQAAQSFYYNSSYSNEANTYLYSTQITGTTQVSAINTLINGLKANNLWSKMKAVYPFVTDKTLQADMAAQMKFNLVNPQDTDAAFRLAFSGGWTYSTNGAQPNGTNGYADTKLNPSISLSTSSAHLSFYSRTNSPSSGYTGYELAIGHYSLITQFQGNTFYSNLEGAGAYNGSYTSTNGLGHFIASRINNTTTQGFKNGSKVINVTQNSTLVNGNLLISSRGGGNYSDKQTAFATIGDGLSDAEAALLYQLIQQYQTDLSRQV